VNRVGAALFVGLMLLVGAACGGDSAAPEPTVTALLQMPTTTTTVATAPPPAPVAVAATTTTSPAPVVPPPTTLPPPPPPPPTTTTTTTTTLPPLPVPVAPPPEDGNEDPELELGSIEIPRIGLERAMYEGIRLSTLDRGPGHWPGTAMPGEFGNVVVAGHRVSHNEDFRNLDQLEPGDEVIFNTATGRHTYHVVSREVVEPDAVWIVDQTPAQTGTLFACHPPGSTRQRIVVHLELAA
jgi:sortase A